MAVKYVVSVDGRDNSIKCSGSEEFIDWYFKVRPDNVTFLGDDSNIEKMRNINKFLNIYFTIKVQLENEMSYYNDLYLSSGNEFVLEAMRQFVSSNRGGKFLRGFLVYLGYKIFGGVGDNYLPLSIALEIFQTSILIHDDIIDKAVLRRGEDTIPVKYKKLYSKVGRHNLSFEVKRDDVANSMALCIGDVGLYFANEILINNYSNLSNFGALLHYYNDMAIKTCKGEFIDVVLPFYEEFYGLDDIENNVMEIYRLKAGYYSVVGPVSLGGILAGADDGEIDSFKEALMNIGIAYQIKDDLLGIFGDDRQTGKSILSDAREFKQTLLYSWAVKAGFKDELLKYYGKSDLSLSELEIIRDIFEKCGARKYCMDVIDKLFDESFEIISKLDYIDDNYRRILLGFAEFLKARRA